jgi:hypothetical protein
MYNRSPATGKSGGEHIGRIAKKAIHNRSRYNGHVSAPALKPGETLKALKSGGTAVILERADGGPTLVEVVTTFVAHHTRPADAAEREEALAGYVAPNGDADPAPDLIEMMWKSVFSGIVTIDDLLAELVLLDRATRFHRHHPNNVLQLAAE